jgi:hypothetical protein
LEFVVVLDPLFVEPFVVDVVSFVVVVAPLDEPWLDPGSANASAKAPATPEMPTAEVTVLTRFLLRRRAWSG